jgi:hypothetical protein
MNRNFAYEATFAARLRRSAHRPHDSPAPCETRRPPVVREAEEDAVAALIGAARKDDVATLETNRRPRCRAVLSSGDPVADKQAREHFLAQYDEKHALVPGRRGKDGSAGRR